MKNQKKVSEMTRDCNRWLKVTLGSPCIAGLLTVVLPGITVSGNQLVTTSTGTLEGHSYSAGAPVVLRGVNLSGAEYACETGTVWDTPQGNQNTINEMMNNWHTTPLGKWVNRFWCWWSGLGLPPKFQAALEVYGRKSGHMRSNPVVITTLEGKRYLVSMLGPESDWVKNIEAAHGDAVIRQGRRHRVHLGLVPRGERAPILREYVRIASSGRRHFPMPVSAPLADFEAIAESYPVYRINAA
jgi:deazaflavin-dependent oxidoreductase (nitroreductase family)